MCFLLPTLDKEVGIEGEREGLALIFFLFPFLSTLTHKQKKILTLSFSGHVQTGTGSTLVFAEGERNCKTASVEKKRENKNENDVVVGIKINRCNSARDKIGVCVCCFFSKRDHIFFILCPPCFVPGSLQDMTVCFRDRIKSTKNKMIFGGIKYIKNMIFETIDRAEARRY